MLRARHRSTGDEGSTLIIALMVLLVLSTLSLGVLARTLSVMSFVRNGQDLDAALATADAGLADAVHLLDAGGDPTASNPRTGTSGAGTWRYRATQVSDTEYDVWALGQVGGSRQGVRARISRGAKYPFALFADRSLDLGAGGLRLGLSSWLTLGGADTGQVRIGTNGRMLLAAGADAGDEQHLYPPDGTCTGCNPATTVVHDDREGPYPLPAVTKPDASTATQACPLLGTFSGVIDGKSGRPFVCERNVVISGIVSVINPPFVLYVLPSSGGTDSSLDLRTAVVNAGQRADNVEIKKAGTAPLLLATTATPATVTFSGVLYAPQSTLRVQGSKSWTGSVTVDSVEPVADALGVAPLLTLGYDLHLNSSAYSSWQVGRYAQVAASVTGLT